MAQRKRNPNPKRKRGRFVPRPRIGPDGEVIDPRVKMLEDWKPKTELGRRVKAGEITTIEEALNSGRRILESEIVDALIPNLETEFINVGQAKGKFGGGQRRIFKQTQKKTKDGNRISFNALAVVGNRDGYVGVGIGRSKETVPAKDKALRNAKLNIIQIGRGNGSWESEAPEPNSIPFEICGRSGSVRVTFMPAPPGTGLVIENELKKLFRLAGIENVWSKSKGQTRQKINLINATIKALKQTATVRLKDQQKAVVRYGSINK
jgi:small subunit ribosomal protein S5